MRKLFTRFLAVAALLSFAGIASAVQYPNATCPDSTGMIFRIQSVPAVTCSPALGDTVAGVGGIIIGFDPIATGFDAYIQTSGGGPFTGIDFFTGSVNTKAAPFNWAIGDSIIIEAGKVADFAGLTEILAPNASTSSPNWIARKVSSGNALPPFFVGTTTQLKETPTNTTAEQYEGCLVKVNGPLTVVRTSLTGGMGSNNSFLLISASAPSDSVFVEGNKLTTYAPPAVGTVIQSVQGILGQATRGYRIWLRDGNDIVAATPPNVTDAYPLTDAVIRVKFDRNVTSASATNTGNYSLASFGSVDAAAMDGTDAVQLTITNGLAHGVNETVTINGVVSTASGLAMTSPQSRTFANGLLSAADVQEANADSLAGASCVDKSRFAGTGGQLAAGATGVRASMAGTVTGRYNNLYYAGDAGNPARGGVAIFAPPATLTIGNQYRFVGAVQEFFGETEFTNISVAEDLGAGASISPAVINVVNAGRDTCDFSNALLDGEDFEGRLVTLRNVKVVQRFPTLPTNGFHVADQSYPDTIFVQNFNNVLTPLVAPALGEVVTVTGHIHYDSGSFRLAPRNYADIVDIGVAGVGGNAGSLAFSVYPNPARTAKFQFTLPTSQDVEIGIYDVSGRQIASLFQGRLAAGSYSKDWAGRDAAGRQVGAGVYFARMKTAGETRAIRTVYLGR